MSYVIENAKDQSKKRLVLDNSVKLTGVGQWIGDSALLAYGATKKNFKIGSVGALGYIAGFAGIRYGNPKLEKQLALVERNLGDFFRHQNIEIPGEPTFANLNKKGGVIDGIEAFLHAYPTQIINTCFTLMGVQLFRDGRQNNITALKISGPLLAAGGLIGLLLKAQKPDPDHPPQGTWEKAKSWVQENPLRATGILAMASPIALTVDGIQAAKANPSDKSYMFKLLAAAGFLLCNTMLGLSHKSEGGGAQIDEETRNKLGEVAARVIAAQPKQVQAALLEQVSGYMASQPYVHKTAPEISELLQEKLAQTSQYAANMRSL